MKTINQINGFCASNQTFEHLANLYKSRRDYSQPENYKTKTYKFKYNYFTSSGIEVERKDRFPFTNFIYRACEVELERFTGHSCDVSDYRREHLRIESKKFDERVQIVLSVDFDGVYIQAVLSDYDFIPGQKFRVRSNQTFAEIDILQYFEQKILRKVLHAAGLFRDIQMANNCDKKQAIAIYRKLKAEMSEPESDFAIERNQEKSFRRHLRKHYNLIVENFLSIREMAKIKNTYGKQAQLTNCENFPITFSDIMTFSDDGDIDEIVSGFYNSLEREKPTIFI